MSNFGRATDCAAPLQPTESCAAKELHCSAEVTGTPLRLWATTGSATSSPSEWKRPAEPRQHAAFFFGRLSLGTSVLCASIVILVGLFSALPARAAADPLDAAFAALQKYDWGPTRNALLPIDAAVLMSYGQPEARRYLEDRLLKVIESDAPRGAKDYVCRKLREMGTARSVPALAALLSDPQLSHMARRALEVISADEATAALNSAVGTLQGDLKLGAICSLGRRADAAAVPVLVTQLKDADVAVQCAAIAALGAIDTPEAARAVLALQSSPPAELQDAVVAACLQIARRQLSKGELDAAANIYRVYEANEAEQLRCAALRGLLEAQPAEAAERVLKALRSDNERFRRFAAQYVGAHASDSLAAKLAEAISELPPTGQRCLLDALSGRVLPSVRKAALQCMENPQPALQVVAANALSSAGEPADVILLADRAAAGEATVRSAAQTALERMPGTDVDSAIVQRVGDAEPNVQVVLIRAMAARRIGNVEPVLFRLIHAQDEAVRVAAFSALETMADALVADELVKCLAVARSGKEREAAQRAVWKSCSQIEDEAERVKPILQQLQQADSQKRAALLPASACSVEQPPGKWLMMRCRILTSR